MTIQADNFIARTSGFGSKRITAYRALIDGLVNDGVWAKLDALYILATLNPSMAVLNLVSTSFRLTPNGFPSFSVDQGYSGVNLSSTVYLDTGLDPTAGGTLYSTNSAHLSAWNNTNLQSPPGAGAVIGDSSIADGASAHVIPSFSDGNTLFAINDFASLSVTSDPDVRGLYVSSRTGATARTGYHNASVMGSDAQASVAFVTGGFTHHILGRGGDGGGTGYAAAANQVMAASIGGGLTGTDVTNLYNRLNTYLSLLPIGPDPVPPRMLGFDTVY